MRSAPHCASVKGLVVELCRLSLSSRTSTSYCLHVLSGYSAFTRNMAKRGGKGSKGGLMGLLESLSARNQRASEADKASANELRDDPVSEFYVRLTWCVR